MCFCEEAREAAGILYRFALIFVFSFVMTNNNEKVGAIFGWHVTFCV